MPKLTRELLVPTRFLYSSADVRAAIIELFGDPRSERVAISAFVGAGASAFLPYPSGIRLICPPTPGATNPDVLRQLIKRGARVEFVDSLHMKVYWARDRGVVITSANLSTNAMGLGGLKESGVLLPATGFGIRRMINGIKPRPAERELRQLDEKHKDYFQRIGWQGGRAPLQSYSEWFDSPLRTAWKLFFYSTISSALSNAAVTIIRDQFDRKACDWIWSEKNVVRKNEWILCGYVRHKRLTGLHWLFADRVIAVPKSDRNYFPDFPFEVIQVHTNNHYPPPPFSVSSRGLTAAFGKVFEDEVRADETYSPYTVSAGKLRSLHERIG